MRIRSMTKYLLSWLFLFASFCPLLYSVTGKSFLMPRPITQDPVLMGSLHHTFLNESEHKNPFALSATAFYENSVNPKSIARYFFPNNKTELSIDTNVTANTDIWTGNLNIVGKDDTPNDALPFSSKIKIRPERKQFGAVIQMLKKFALFKRFFVSLDIPLVQVEHNLKLKEYDIVNGARNHNELGLVNGNDIKDKFNFFINATEALNSPTWKYGKIKNGLQKLAGIADIDVALGYEIKSGYWSNCSIKAGVTIPVGYKPKAEFVFEPLIGSTRHCAVGLSIDGDIVMLKKDLYTLRLKGMLDARYLLEDTELRTFDLKSRGPWSRYISCVDVIDAFDLDPESPAVNFLTLKARVTPRSAINMVANIQTEFNWGDVVVGYNLWGRQKEKLSLKQLPKEGLTFTVESINQIAADSQPITNDDISIESATNQGVISHSLFATVNLMGSLHENQVLYTAGVKYEFNDSNRAIDVWAFRIGMQIAI